MTDDKTLRPEHYLEPRCVLCEEPYGAAPQIKPIPQQRILAKMNEYMAGRDFAGAERHLLYWLEEAKLGHDERGELFLHGELIGHYRKTNEEEKCLASVEEALRLIDALDYGDSISAGTTYVNIATALNAFGRNEESLPYFEKAKAIYEAHENTDPELLGGLYNNMALTCVALKRYDEALSLYDKALACMGKVPGGWLEQAITYLNMADAYSARDGLFAAEDTIYGLLGRAADLFDTPEVGTPGGVDPGYYAYVCRTCSPVFDHYGYFMTAMELSNRAKQYYESREREGK